jgi:hypothetical protein
MRGLSLYACLGVVFALLLNSTAHAAIGPIPRPDAPKNLRSPKPKANTHPAAQHQFARRQPVTSPSVATRTPAPPRTRKPAPVVSRGGRERRPFAPFVSTGGRIHPALPRARTAKIVATRLAVVGGHEPLPSYDAWPSWLLAVLALLAFTEAFLLVHLARPLPVRSPSSAPSAADTLSSKPLSAAGRPPQSPEGA